VPEAIPQVTPVSPADKKLGMWHLSFFP
jgi:hypothetical protein